MSKFSSVMRISDSAPRPAFMLRASALLACSALVVHELRYLVGWGSQAEHALASHGHSYLGLATPLTLLVLTAAFAAFLSKLTRGGSPAEGAPIRLWKVWLTAWLALLAIYTCQELVEGALSPGHPSGLPGLIEASGWTALPLAAAFGGLVALLLRGAEAALARVAARATSRVKRGALVVARPTWGDLLVTASMGLPRHLAGRAPPLRSARC